MADLQKDLLLNVEIKGTEALKKLAEMKIAVQDLQEAKKKESGATEESRQKIEAYNQQIKAATTVMSSYSREIKGNIQTEVEKQGSIDQMKSRLSSLTAAYNRLSAEERNSANGQGMKQEIIGLTASLTQAEQSLGNFHRQVGNYELAGKSLRGELRQLTQQMAEMRLAGETNSEEYQKLVQKVGDYKKAMIGATKEMANASDRNLKLNGAIQAVQGLTSAYALYNSVAGLVGAKNEELNKIAQKSMLLLTALNSLEQIRNALLSTSKVRTVARIVIDKIEVALKEREVKARAAHIAMIGAENTATKTATAIQWLWNAALAANPLGAIIVAIAAAIGAYALFTKILGQNKDANDEQVKAQKRHEEAIKENTENQKKYAEDIGQSVGALMAKYEDLRLKYTELGDNLKAKNKFIKENKDNFKELGISVNNVTEADNVFIKNTAAAIQAMMARAQAQANMNLAIQAYQKAAELQNSQVTVQRQYKMARGKEVEDYMEEGAMLDKAQKERNRKVKSLTDEGNNYILKAQQKTNEANTKFQNAGIKQAIETGKKTVKNAKDIAEKLKELQDARRENEKKNLEEEYAGMTTDFLKKQEYEKKVFELQQKYDKEDLAAQLKSKKITENTYNLRLNTMEKSYKAFNKKQTKELEDDLKQRLEIETKSTDLLLKEAQRKADEDIAIATKEIMAKNGIKDESGIDEKTDEEIKTYTLARTRKLAEEQDKIKQDSLDKSIKEITDKLDKEYKGDLGKYSDNESKELELNIAKQKELIAEKKKIQGADTGGDEAQLRSFELQQQTLLLNKELANEQLTAKQKYEIKKKALEKELEIYSGNADKEREINKELAENEKEYAQAKIDNLNKWSEKVSSIANDLNSLLSAIEDNELSDYEDKNDKKKKSLKERLDNGLITQKEYDKQVAALDENLDKEKKKIAIKQAKRERLIKIFEIATSTAAAIMKILSQGGIYATPLIALAAAQGAVQTAAVLAAPLPKASKGLILKGKSHAQGGIPIEAEGGEAIINKRSTAMYMPLLSAINQAGGGVAFSKFQDGGYVARNSNNGSNDVIIKLEEVKNAIGNMKIITTIEDINREQKKYNKIQERGNY